MKCPLRLELPQSRLPSSPYAREISWQSHYGTVTWWSSCGLDEGWKPPVGAGARDLPVEDGGPDPGCGRRSG